MPPGRDLYPRGLTRPQIEQYVREHPADKAAIYDPYTVVKRVGTRLTGTPYRVEFKEFLEPMARALRDAAALSDDAAFAHFLRLRADALLSDDYYASDLAWMQLDSPIEPTIGPYETYEDEWFGYKAAFEAFIAVRDDEETARLATIGGHLQAIESALPVDPRFRNPTLGTLAPIRVVNLLFAAGDGNRGVQTAAFNLPNDERIIREQGAKRVMLKNVQEAKFHQVLRPIAETVLAPDDRARVSFDAFFAHILLHELMHGLGPHQVHATGGAVRLALKDTYAAIEEAKADISGLWALQWLADRNVIPAAVSQSMYRTFLAGAFRTLRFGITEAHARGMAIQLNSLLDAGAVVAGADGTFRIDDSRVRDAVAALTGRIMTNQAHGDHGAAAAMIEQATIRPAVQQVLDRLDDVPVDIAPDFQTARELEDS
jgi:hypothetical protein